MIDGNLPEPIMGRTLFSRVGNWIVVLMVVIALAVPFFVDKSKTKN